MKRTNINIINNDHSFNYLIEYSQDSLNRDLDDLMYMSIPYQKRVDIVGDSDYIYYGNDWYSKDNWGEFMESDYITEYMPNSYNRSVIKFNFPEYSPEIYESNIYYMLNINTWINGRYVYLGSKLFRRYDALANDSMIRFESNKYNESIEFAIIDPFDIQYGDNWKDFRINVCGERIDGEGETINNTGAQLCFSLYIVEEDSNGGWIKKVNYNGGQNSINITLQEDDYLMLNQTIKFNESKGLIIQQNIVFNKLYGADLKTYLSETYGINISKMKYALVIKDNNRVYAGIDETGKENIIKEEFTTSTSFDKNDINIKNWDEWSDWENRWNTNVSFASSVTFYDENNNNLLYLVSNEIPITQDIYKYLINDDFETKYIDLSDINMEVKNFNVVNKIINQIVQFDKPDDSKSNIIQPVFFKTRDLQDLIIHPEVTENVCINLDAYKSKVEIFSIQIEGCNFKQIGANGYGIIFKIIGKNLPNKKKSGVYYILNEDGELVTTGKYIYEE